MSKDLGKTVKKLLFTNRFTIEEISGMLDTPIEECVKAYESYFNSPIPSSLFIVGNQKQRSKLKKNIVNGKHTLIYGGVGTGKTTSVKQITDDLRLNLIKINPIDPEEIAKKFGGGPTQDNKNVYLIEADSLPKKKYSILRSYIKNSKRPIVIITEHKKTLHGNVRRLLEKIPFTTPGPMEIKTFLNKKYGWNGDIQDIYDPDMRVVISRVLNSSKLSKPEPMEEMGSREVAEELSYGYFSDFEKLSEPLWWVIRWLAYNQTRKFRKKSDQLENLKKLSFIDHKKHKWNETYLHNMLMGLKGSPRKAYFKFPPWPKKKKEEEFVKIKKKKTEEFKIDSWL